MTLLSKHHWTIYSHFLLVSPLCVETPRTWPATVKDEANKGVEVLREGNGPLTRVQCFCPDKPWTWSFESTQINLRNEIYFSISYIRAATCVRRCSLCDRIDRNRTSETLGSPHVICSPTLHLGSGSGVMHWKKTFCIRGVLKMRRFFFWPGPNAS